MINSASSLSSTRKMKYTLVVLSTLLLPALARAQEAKIRDLTTAEGALPVRLMGYGLVIGLDGTGDRAIGGQTGGQTVQSVVNMLRRFNIEVPAEAMRMRNVAAVMVTAEVSPYLRAGGRFEINVSSMGDARSLRGGALFMTPLSADVGGKNVASAQGSVLISEGGSTTRYAKTVETSARIPTGGVLEADLPRPAIVASSRLMLRDPELGTATRIAAAINTAFGDKTATVEDEGSVLVTLADSVVKPTALAKIRDLSVRAEKPPRIIVDSKDGTVVAGGDMVIGAASISHGVVTLVIGGDKAMEGDTITAGNLRLPVGVSVQRVASALHAVQTPAVEIAAILSALREAGALAAEIIVR
ncbi:MAG: flagellar basal body P-ring protein FlgI [Gemmatimonadaceae bacterium]